MALLQRIPLPSGCRPSQIREKYPPKYTINATIKMLVMDCLWLVSHYYFSTWLFDSPPQVCCLPDKQLGFGGWKACSFFSDTYFFRRYFWRHLTVVWWICRSTRTRRRNVDWSHCTYPPGSTCTLSSQSTCTCSRGIFYFHTSSRKRILEWRSTMLQSSIPLSPFLPRGVNGFEPEKSQVGVSYVYM